MHNTTRSILLAAVMGLIPGLATAGPVLICVTKPVPMKVSKAQQSLGGMAAIRQLNSTAWLTGPFAHTVNHANFHCSDGRITTLTGLLMSGGFRLISVRPVLHPERVYKKPVKPAKKGKPGAKAPPVPNVAVSPFSLHMDWQAVATLVAGG